MTLSKMIRNIDISITKFVQNGQPNQNGNPSLGIRIFKIITNSMTPVAVIAALTISSVLVIISNIFSAEMAMLILSVLPIVTGSYLKKIISKARPNELDVKVWVREKSYNFPSTHAAVAVSLYGFLAFISVWYQKSPFLAILAITMVILISYSRIYLGAHFPSDVFGGIILGLINLTLLIYTYTTIPHKFLSVKIVWILLIIGWVFVIKFYKKYPDNIPDFLYQIPKYLSRIYTGVLILIISLGSAWLGGLTFKIFMWTILIIGLGEIFCVETKKEKKEYLKMCSAVLIAIFMNSIVALRDLGEGRFLTFLFILVAATSDVSGWGIGKLFGKYKIFPSISPNKTLGGTLAAIIIPVALIGSMAKIQSSYLIILILSVSAIIGDLLESALKRKLGIKDFSNFLPGHGGILDRTDSQFFTGFILYILYQLNIIRFL